eukprot:COSAG02_NODE_60022_length_272_cov_0.901734_1_plen_29_part_10
MRPAPKMDRLGTSDVVGLLLDLRGSNSLL